MALCRDSNGIWMNGATETCCSYIGGGQHYYENVSGKLLKCVQFLSGFRTFSKSNRELFVVLLISQG
jgi:hypothetical protein